MYDRISNCAVGYNWISDIGGYPSPDTFSDEIAEAFLDYEFNSIETQKLQHSEYNS